MAAISGEQKYFGKLPRVHWLDIMWVENFDEIALSRTVKEKDIFMFFCYVAITQEVKDITINNNTKQAIDAINLHTNF